jgi:predicted DNA-binding transcriptional regulator YafY
MRADRLLSLLMLLQARGKMTARELAKELEVAERTVYRDIDALSAAGVPVYGELGRDGGYALLDSYRTNLTGLSEGEARALFMLSIPAPLADLGVGEALKTALRKLAAALPDARRQDEARTRQRFHLDSTWWRQGVGVTPHLKALQQAVLDDRRVHLTYNLGPYGPVAEIARTVDPYGLVAKAGVWHLVCARDGRVRVHRVRDVIDACLADERFERPLHFDLAAFWQGWCAEQAAGRAAYPVTAAVAPAFLRALPRYLGEHVSPTPRSAPPDARGWVTVELTFESLEEARGRLLSCGAGVEVLAPLALRHSILDHAAQVVALYDGRPPTVDGRPPTADD